MASSVIILYSGPPEQRHSVKVTAMQPLSAVLPAVCAKFRPALDPGSVTLALSKKTVDLGVPFRLANIPSGSILSITSARPAAAAAAAAGAPAAGEQPAPAPAAQAAPAAEPLVLPPPVAAAPPSGSEVTGPSLQPVSVEQGTIAHMQTEPQEPPQPQPQPQPPLQPQQQPSAAAGVSAAPLVDLLHLSRAAGLSPTREALLTTEAALKQQQHLRLHQQAGGIASGGGGSSGGVLQDEHMGGDDEDSFYELTPEDLAVIVKAAEARRKEEAQGLKTQAMRDAEEQARIQAFGPVALRLRFRDGIVLQAQFAATDTIHTVQEFMRQLLALPPSQGVTLFTAPPKQVLKDNSQPLFKAGLVPAALVHVQLPGTGPTLDALKPQVAACLITALAPEQPLPGLPQRQGGAAGALEQGGTSVERAGASTSASAPSSTAATAEAVAAVAAARAAARNAQPQAHQASGEGGPKAPKWFKR